MVVCDLDKEVSGEILGWKLPAWQALLLHRVLPSCGGFIIYLTSMCFDFALIIEHFMSGEEGLGMFCTILMIIPALLSMVFTLASPPPGLETELSAFTMNVEKNDVRWIVMQFVNTLFFPVTALGRYIFLIFWWVEAVCASRAGEKERTREAILQARAPSPTELYLFLQAFIHAAPYTIVNVIYLMTRFRSLTFDKASIQAVSIVASSLRMASTATIYRRFEREKLCGKKYPWGKNVNGMKDTSDETALATADNTQDSDKEPIYETLLRKTVISPELSIDRNQLNSDLIQFSPRNTAHDSFFEDASISDTSSDYLPPMSTRCTQTSVNDNSDDEYIRPISIIDKVAPRRRDTEYTIERVHITPPPVIPAPRPGSIAVWAEKMMENAEALPTWLSAPPRRKYCDEVIQDEPDIPYRVPRNYMRGLEPQDVSAALVHFLGWHMFFVARLLSIACFILAYPVVAIIILFIHYQVMLLFLIIPQASTVKRGFYIFLAFIYLFCLMEFKIRFRHVRVWHVFWIIVSTMETVVFTGVWASSSTSLTDWWKHYVIYIIMGSLLLSYMCFLVYFVLLKPRETIVYINTKTNAN